MNPVARIMPIAPRESPVKVKCTCLPDCVILQEIFTESFMSEALGASIFPSMFHCIFGSDSAVNLQYPLKSYSGFCCMTCSSPATNTEMIEPDSKRFASEIIRFANAPDLMVPAKSSIPHISAGIVVSAASAVSSFKP